MTEREDQGRALLRLLQGVQVSDTPAVERHETLSHHEFASGTLFPSTLHMTDVRGAATAEQHDNAHRNPTASNIDVYPYHLPRPGASSSSPARSAGTDLLRMLQGAPQSSATTMSTTRQRQRSLQRHYAQDLTPPSLPPPAAQHQHYHQYQQQHQQHLQHQDLTLPTPSPPIFPRSVAAEQERFLKKFLRIDSPDNEAKSTPTFSTTPLCPAPSSEPLALSAPATAISTSIPAVVENGDQEGQERNKSRTKERGKSRGPRGGWSRGGGGGGSGGGENDAEISSTPARERSKRSVSLARGHMEASHRGKGGQKGRGPRTQIETNGREGKKGGRGGGGRNGGGGGGRSRARSPSPSTAYAWSAFQNSPDPKNIPIPSLSHFSLSSETSAGDEAPVLESSSCRDEMVVGDGRPPPERDARLTGDTRSSAQRAEADIKKMLGLG